MTRSPALPRRRPRIRQRLLALLPGRRLPVLPPGQRLPVPRLVQRPLALVLALALALPAPWARAQAQAGLPALGDSASEDLRVGDERRLGLQIMREIRRDPAYLDDPVLLDYMHSLWQPLVASGRRLGHIGDDTDAAFGWELFLVRDRAVNAFALPGGFIGVYLGLIALTETADELASVLAHELAHVTQRHIARSLGSAQRVGVVSMAAMILALLAASRAGSADVAQAAVLGGQAAMIQGQLNFSREMEREADRIGFTMFDAAGFAAQGMASMFERLAFANRLMDSQAYPYLRSHPLTTERIAEARGRLPLAAGGDPGRPLAGAATDAAALHALMRARARVMMASTGSEWQALQQGLGERDPAGGELADRAQRTMAAVALRDAAAARREAAALLAAAAEPATGAALRQAAHRIAAEALLAADAPAAAADALAAADAGQGRPGLLLRAELALVQARSEPGEAAAVRRSAEALQVWTAEHPTDARAWSLLATTARAAALPLRAQRAEAEARAALGDLPGAVERLRTAQRMAGEGGGDWIEQQAIDARLRALQRELDLLRAEARGRP